MWRPWVEPINDGKTVHIWRLHLVDWPFRLYLHHILRPDNDRFMHNHPRPFASVVLRGGYIEQTCERFEPAFFRNRGAGGSLFNFMSVNRFHRIVYVQPHTWTLLLGRYRKEPSDWGFLTEDHDIIPQDQWVNHPERAMS